MQKVEYVNILGVNIAAVDIISAVEMLTKNLDDARGKYVCVSNVHTTIMATESIAYNNIQNQSYLSLPDGKPLSVIGKMRGYSNIDRVTGPELMEEIFKFAPESNHYFYGNTAENLEILIHKLREKYPTLNIVGYKHSVFRELSQDENNSLLQEINNCKADYVWVGLGAPKQEEFMYKNREQTNAVMIGVGGAFNVISGVSPRAPKWMQNLSLEWLFRLIDDPKRLWRRYLNTNLKFIYFIIGGIYEKK